MVAEVASKWNQVRAKLIRMAEIVGDSSIKASSIAILML